MLDEIVLKTKERVEESKKNKSLDYLKKEVLALEISKEFQFKKALSDEDIYIIAKVKRTTPQKCLNVYNIEYM